MSHRYVLLSLIVTFVLLGIVYSAHTPYFEAPDEAAHFRYIDHLIETRTLPRIAGNRSDLFATFNVEVHQPPLYYALAALPVQLWDRSALDAAIRANPFAAIGTVSGNNENVLLYAPTFDGSLARAVWTARLVSLALGLLTVWAVYRAGALAWDRRVGLGAAALVVSLPTFVHISASVNNDNITNAVYAVGTMLALQVWTRRTITWGDTLALGVVLSAAALSKTTGLTDRKSVV
jgi:4-amino-4-deoxy-L-arabinose transferase-like glycosyltransferase